MACELSALLTLRELVLDVLDETHVTAEEERPLDVPPICVCDTLRRLKFCSSDCDEEAVTRSDESSDVWRCSALLELVLVELDSWRDIS